jgi:hypothetical protein
MQRFDYNKQKRQTVHGVTEEIFREEHEREKKDAQSNVDAVLYSDVSMRNKPSSASSSETPSQNDSNASSTDTTDVEPVEETVPVDSTENEADTSVPEEESADSYLVSGLYRSGEDDAFADDAEDGASEYDPSDDIGSDVVETEPELNEYEEPIVDTSSYPETDDENELARREAEADLRKRTAAANAKNRPKSKSVKKQTNASDEVQMSTLKKFPSELAYHIKSLFPEARTMDDAVAAYVYLKEGEPDDIRVPYEIKKLVKCYIGDSVTPKDVQDEIMKELYKIREYNTRFMKKLNSVELGVTYTLFDRLGFRKANALSPSELNFLEAGIADLLKQLEKQSEIKQNRDSQRSGRPIK